MTIRLPVSYLLIVPALAMLCAPASAQFIYGRLIPDINLEANGASTAVDVSADGRTVVFASTAQNWVGDAYNGTRAVVVDLDTGLIDVASTDGTGVFRGEHPVVSDDGRFVTFLTYGHPSGPGWQVLRKDRQTAQVLLASSNVIGQAAQNGTDDDTVSMSTDGRYVVFASASTNLGVATGGNTEIIQKDMLAGTVELVTAKPDGSASGGNCSLYPHALSGDGRLVTFTCSQDLFPGAGWGQTYVRDVVNNTSELISRVGASGASSTAATARPAISANGRYVSFQSRCYGGLGAVNGDCINNSGVYLRDRQTQTTIPIPRPADLDASYTESCRDTAVSDLGTVIMACNAPAGPSASKYVVFLYVPGQGAPELLSSNNAGEMPNGQSGYSLAVNANGLSMAFESTANDIDPGDGNSASDIFVLVHQSLLSDTIFADGFEN